MHSTSRDDDEGVAWDTSDPKSLHILGLYFLHESTSRSYIRESECHLRPDKRSEWSESEKEHRCEKMKKKGNERDLCCFVFHFRDFSFWFHCMTHWLTDCLSLTVMCMCGSKGKRRQEKRVFKFRVWPETEHHVMREKRHGKILLSFSPSSPDATTIMFQEKVFPSPSSFISFSLCVWIEESKIQNRRAEAGFIWWWWRGGEGVSKRTRGNAIQVNFLLSWTFYPSSFVHIYTQTYTHLLLLLPVKRGGIEKSFVGSQLKKGGKDSGWREREWVRCFLLYLCSMCDSRLVVIITSLHLISQTTGRMRMWMWLTCDRETFWSDEEEVSPHS